MQVTVSNPNPLMTLNEYIRTVANLKVRFGRPHQDAASHADIL